MKSLEVVSVRKARKFLCLETGRVEGERALSFVGKTESRKMQGLFEGGQRRKKKGGRALGKFSDVREFKMEENFRCKRI